MSKLALLFCLAFLVVFIFPNEARQPHSNRRNRERHSKEEDDNDDHDHVSVEEDSSRCASKYDISNFLFSCQNSDRVIPGELYCDGYPDCADESDELGDDCDSSYAATVGKYRLDGANADDDNDEDKYDRSDDDDSSRYKEIELVLDEEDDNNDEDDKHKNIRRKKTRSVY